MPARSVCLLQAIAFGVACLLSPILEGGGYAGSWPKAVHILAGFAASFLQPLAAEENSQNKHRGEPEWGQQRSLELEDYLERIDTAQQMRNYNLVLKLLLDAQQKFPKAALLWFLSGELYEQQNLLRLSLESYQRAHDLAPGDIRFLYGVANVQDRLGKYAEAVDSYRLLAEIGNSVEKNEARRKNGWLLYKLHRYQEAESSILAIPPEERDSRIMMTLAIIYSAAYNYEESRKAYEQSLALTHLQWNPSNGYNNEAALRNMQNSIRHRALIYYNYALLEVDFRHFDRAMELNEGSIKSRSFPSNELLRGELYLQQRQFSKAKEAFLKSQRLEEMSSEPSPLALLDLVQLGLDRGTYGESRIYFQELEQRFSNQTEWMTSYGIDMINFELELIKLHTTLYRGLLQEQKWFLPITWGERFQRLVNIVKYNWIYWYSSIRQKLLAYQVGKEHYQQGNQLDSDQKLYDASDKGSHLGYSFFQSLKKERLALIPKSKGVLLLEEAVLERSTAKIGNSIELLSKKWDVEEREQAFIELSRLRTQPQQRYQDLLQAYYANRASLKNHGVRLPLQLQLSGSAAYRPEQQKMERKLRNYFERSGAEIVYETDAPTLRLQIQWSQEQVRAYLLSEKGTVLRSIDSKLLQSIMEKQRDDSLSSSEEDRILKRFVRYFMQQAFSPVS